MPRTLTLLLLAGALAAPPCAPAATQTNQQQPAAARTAAPAEDDFERGKRLYTGGDVAAALPLLKRAAEARKKDADAWYYLGLALNRLGKTKDARKAFEKSLKARPDSAAAHASLAYTLLLLGKTRDAERETERAIELDPKLAEAHYIRGALLFQGESYVPAAVETGEALRLRPDFPAAALLHGDILLNAYISQTLLQAAVYPLPAAAGEAERKAVFEKRDAALEPFKARMRELAVRLEGFAAASAAADAAVRFREVAESLRVYARARGGEPEGVFRQGEVTSRAVILKKPEPGFSEEARKEGVTGTVRLRAVLAADGQVRHIIAIKRLPAGLTEVCVAAARKIRFKPATVNGAPVSQWVILEYNFNIY